MPLPTIGKDVSPARRKALRSLAGKAVLFLDTCHAAGAIENGSWRGLACLDINSVINEFASAENGVVAFASSTGREGSIFDHSVTRSDWGPLKQLHLGGRRVVRHLLRFCCDCSRPLLAQPV
jgi:hypothetical protein